MISKELLSEVLNDKKILLSKNDLLIGDNVLLFDNQCNYLVNINIYELSHKCKEWAFDKGYSLESAKRAVLGKDNKMTNAWICCGFTSTYEVLPNFTATTEPEAIFKACEWIMEQTK